MAFHTHLHRPQTAYDQPRLHRTDDSAKKLPLLPQARHELLVLHSENTSDNIAVSAHILGGGVHHNISPQLQRLLVNRRTEAVVNIDVSVVFPRCPGHRLNVLKGQYDRRRALQDNQIRLIRDGIFKFLRLIPFYIGDTHIQVFPAVFIEKCL